MKPALCPPLALAAALTLASCNSAPLKNLERSFTMQVQVDTGTDEPIPIDFLWVVDNSSSMCEEQRSLSQSFEDFTSRIDAAFQIDPHLAVTSHEVQCGVDPAKKIYSSMGVFNTVPTTAFPPPCQERRIRACTDDTPCENMDCVVQGSCGLDEPDCPCPEPRGRWTCSTPTNESCLENPNGTINSHCVRRCETDAECQELFGDPGYLCQKPSTSADDWGCIRPPDTGSCPATVPPVLDGTNLELFPCAATVGVNQEKCFRYEQGMNAALWAIDTDGPNAEQARTFLRDDAYLVIIFVSDEDDCSVTDPARPGIIGEDDYDTCALLPTSDQGGPLVPVGHFVNRFKGLKQDPGKVIIAAIAGDSAGEDPATMAADREAYAASKGDPKTCFDQTYICLSESGKADYGARYLELAESFGPNGKFTNICDDEGIGPALKTIADTILTVLNQVCLPRLIDDEADLVVVRRRGEEVVTLTPDDYRVLPPSDSCAVDGVPMPAVAFNAPPVPGEAFTITYQGDPQLD